MRAHKVRQRGGARLFLQGQTVYQKYSAYIVNILLLIYFQDVFGTKHVFRVLDHSSY